MSIKSMQDFTDWLKSSVLDMEGVDKQLRLSALRTINQLERCPWHAMAMTDAIEVVANSRVFDRHTLLALGKGDDFLNNVTHIYDEYCKLIDCEQNELDAVMNMHEAAEFLGIGYDMMKTYVSREKRIRGKQVGRSMVFTRQQLEKFRDNDMRPPGRPSEE
jgi:hypothetical protein